MSQIEIVIFTVFLSRMKTQDTLTMYEALLYIWFNVVERSKLGDVPLYGECQ